MARRLSSETKRRFYDLAVATHSLNSDNLPSWSALCQRIGESPQLLKIVENFLNSRAMSHDLGQFPQTVIVQPQEPKTPTIARVFLEGNLVSVRFPEKRDDFRALVKGLGYTWERPRWEREIDRWAGNPQDRATELGHHLLAAGFCCIFPSVEIRQAAISGNYEPEQKRWVKVRIKGEYNNWFALWWRYSEDCYSEAMKMSGAKYSKPCVIVPPECYAEVEDFATLNGFAWSDAALDVLEQVKAWRDSAMIVPEIEIGQRPLNGNGRPELEIPELVEIDDELADDL